MVTDFDIAIIGGGIHGVGVAQAAAAAGYSTVLLEKEFLAYGTSRWSSKLIHGGLRYLESGNIALVRESLHERELLLKLAPDLVTRCDFHIPIYQETQRKAWQIRLGLTAYSVLAGASKATRFSSLPKSQWPALDGITTDNLRQVFRYTDAQTDDAKLTQAVMQSARQLGATLLCPAEVTQIVLDENVVTVRYKTSGNLEQLRCKAVVNAAGPWINRLLEHCSTEQTQTPIDLVEGTHIELPSSVDKGCYYLEVPEDRRAVFVMPWQGHRLVGTTEGIYRGCADEVSSRQLSVDYLLRAYSHYFPNAKTEVLKQWTGLRVLPKATGSAFKRSRETQLPTDRPSKPRIISIIGGKLTGYRATAMKVIKALETSLPKVRPIARTDELPLRVSDDHDVERSN